MTDAQTLAQVRLLAQRHCTPAANPSAHNLAHKVLAALDAAPLPAAGLHAQDAAPRRVDRAAGIIFGVKIVGNEIRNNHEHPPSVLRQAIPLYEGAMVNIDHAEPNTYRRAADRFGQLQYRNRQTPDAARRV